MKFARNLIIFAALSFAPLHADAHQATGFKIGEVTTDSAIIWTRITKNVEPNSYKDGIMPTFVAADGSELTPDGFKRPKKKVDPKEIRWPEGKGFEDIRYGAPGAEGETRVLYRTEDGSDDWSETAWGAVDPKADFIRQILIDGLEPSTVYEMKVQTRSATAGSTLEGGFKTAPAADDEDSKVVFTVSTGQAFWDQDIEDFGFQIYPTMLAKTRPDFFVHTGDIVYYDSHAKSVDLANWHWQRTYSRPTNVDFHRQVPSYFIKDDHDTLTNDCWSTMKPKMGSFTWDDGIRIFKDQTPQREKTYRTFRWGKDLQIWLVEGRDFRSPNPDPDGPDKTIWGAEQMAWLKKTVAESDATFRILFSPTPIVGPDRGGKQDNHSNSNFQHEGKLVREFLASQERMVVVCGDRHWQYHSIDPVTKLREYSCGPASNEHAGGWSQSDYREDFHQFLRVQGGYLSGTVERIDAKPRLTFQFHSVHGKVAFESVVE
ncbi:MAG: alkaline phosphatase D [Verrucomicrobiales bacterium]|jgi:alkaline phosphatase D